MLEEFSLVLKKLLTSVDRKAANALLGAANGQVPADLCILHWIIDGKGWRARQCCLCTSTCTCLGCAGGMVCWQHRSSGCPGMHVCRLRRRISAPCMHFDHAAKLAAACSAYPL